MPPRPARPAAAPRRAPRSASTRGGVDSFDDASLLAELAGDEDDDRDDGEFESHEELEARLTRELAAMPDAHAAEEKTLLAAIHGMEDEPDEGDVLMAQLLREEQAKHDALRARMAANAKDATRAQRATSSSSSAAAAASKTAGADGGDSEAPEQLRAACTAAKHEAVRLKRAGDMEGARNALRKAKELQARAEAAEAAEAAESRAQRRQPPAPPPPPTQHQQSAQDALAAALRALGDAVEADDYYDADGGGGDGNGDGDGVGDEDEEEGSAGEELRSELAALCGDEPPPPPPTVCPHTPAPIPLNADQLREAIAGAKREAVGQKRAGDMDRARAALKLSKELQAMLDALLVPSPPPPTQRPQNQQRPPQPTSTAAAAAAAEVALASPHAPPMTDHGPRREELDAMMAAAIGAVVSVISEDPNSQANLPQYEGAEEDDDGFSSHSNSGGARGGDAAHFGGEYQREGREQEEEEEEELDEEQMLLERVAELASLPTEAAVTEAKRTALGRKRAGDVEGAKAALRAAKAHQAELEDTRALLA